MNLRFTRREFVKWAAGAAVMLPTARISLAANPTEKPLHGLSAFGELKYAADFRQFDYANPDAPRAKRLSFAPPNWRFNQNVQTFNTLNTFVLLGEAPARLEECYATLMTGAWDEPDAIYGMVAETVTISADRNVYKFKLRPQARFHDGSPITAGDLVWTVETLKEKGHPQISLDLAEIARAEAPDPQTLVLTFTGKQTDRTILSVASGLPVLSKAWHEGKEFEAVTEASVGSGRYRVGRVEFGRFIEYERMPDWWAEDLPVSRGLDHFDTIRIDVFQERQAAFEAFKKGEIDIRQEFTSKAWATEYNFPAVQQGRVRKVEFPDEKTPSLQAFALNLRRPQFAHPGTRKGIATLFDFEWTNRNLFFGIYARSDSLFENSELKAQGAPGADELALLEPLRDKLPGDVFGEAVKQFVSDGSGRDRAMLREADRHFTEAGWRKDAGRLVGADGKPLTLEILIDESAFERILLPFIDNLKRSGVEANLRQVDPSQYQSRIEDNDFDMMMVAYSLSANPSGELLRRFFHSEWAPRKGTDNHPGVADPAIDVLVEKATAAQTREELVTAMRALDRVLRANCYWIPNWHSANHRMAIWDMFGWKDPKPDYAFPVERLWWIDPAKAAAIGRA